jgi:hypothetical protein
VNIFERASRAKLRFSSPRGELTTEQLWDLPLLAKRDDAPDLDKLARAASRELRNLAEDSFVNAKPDPRKSEMELRLKILKHMIASKEADIKAAESRAANIEQRNEILAALQAKQKAGLLDLTEEQLKARLEALSTASV